MTTICQLARKDKKYTHKPTIQHIHLMYSKVTAIFNTCTHKQTYICSTIIINHMTTTSQNNNSEHLPLRVCLDIAYLLKTENLLLETL